MRIIDATHHRLGRLATAIAKYALDGDEIIIVNSEHAVIVGNKKDIIEKYQNRLKIGSRYKGPFFPRKPDKILKRTIRGMLPYKEKRGRDALKRIKVYIGVPSEFDGKEFEKIKRASLGDVEKRKYIDLATLSKYIGGLK